MISLQFLAINAIAGIKTGLARFGSGWREKKTAANERGTVLAVLQNADLRACDQPWALPNSSEPGTRFASRCSSRGTSPTCGA
jgi:hypothetical protein